MHWDSHKLFEHPCTTANDQSLGVNGGNVTSSFKSSSVCVSFVDLVSAVACAALDEKVKDRKQETQVNRRPAPMTQALLRLGVEDFC